MTINLNLDDSKFWLWCAIGVFHLYSYRGGWVNVVRTKSEKAAELSVKNLPIAVPRVLLWVFFSDKARDFPLFVRIWASKTE